MHTSIALWGHPRSLSTALERSFIERGDFKVFHEAFSYVYFMHEERTTLPHQNPDPEHPRTYRAVRDMMERARLDRPVFHKDFPYHAIDHLLRDPDYLLGQVNTFLIRDPEEAVLSHANVHPDVTPATLGYAEQARLFDFIRELTGETPLVVNAADLADDPKGTIAGFCAHVGIPVVPAAISWSAGSRPEWSTWEGWHADVIGSSGIGKPSAKYRFSYADKPHLRDYVAQCRPFYEHLDQYRISPVKEAAE